MFQKIKNWFFKKEEVKAQETTIRELHAAVFKAVPENNNPVKATPTTVVAPGAGVSALTSDQIGTISLASIGSLTYTTSPVDQQVYTTTITTSPVDQQVYTTTITTSPVDQQAVVNAAEGSAVQAVPEKKPRKPRKKDVSVEMQPLAAWPFPMEKPLAAVTPEELEALKTPTVAMKAKKPRKSVVPKQG